MKAQGLVRTSFAAAILLTVLQVNAAAAAWVNLGGGLAGASGVPLLIGTGTLVAPAPTKLELAFASPGANTLLLISLASAPTPFKGGTLVPVPPAAILLLPADALG